MIYCKKTNGSHNLFDRNKLNILFKIPNFISFQRIKEIYLKINYIPFRYNYIFYEIKH